MEATVNHTIIIRTATEEDIPAMLGIYNEIILNTTAVYDYHPHTLQMRTLWFEAKREQGWPVYVAVDNQELLGFSSIGPFRAWAAYQFSVENSIYIRSDQRGKGLGSLLLKPLITAAGVMEMHTMIAGIDASNISSLRLHQRHGFQEVAHFREVGWKFERWLDLKFLQLLLERKKDTEDKK